MIGIDIVQISRIEGLYEKFGQKFLDKILTKSEQNLIKNENGEIKFQTLAGFYATKEAFSKALSVGISAQFSFLDLQILKTSKNAPILEISPKILENFHIKNSAVSISHEADFAISAVILEI